MYWKMTEDNHNRIVTSLFTRNKFNEVLKNVHLADNDNLDNNHKFVKVYPLIEILNKNCLSNSILEIHASIGESMAPYYGCHGCKQYMQSKPVNSEYKL